jgi:hypothetical protein
MGSHPSRGETHVTRCGKRGTGPLPVELGWRGGSRNLRKADLISVLVEEIQGENHSVQVTAGFLHETNHITQRVHMLELTSRVVCTIRRLRFQRATP